MGSKTGISWTDATWNCIRGCSRVSEGCRHCYAETMAGRFCGPGMPYEGLAERRPRATGYTADNGEPEMKLEARWTGEVRFIPERLADPIRWRTPKRIFVNSMADLFHEKLSNEQIAAVFGVMAACPHHTFQVLTKRAKRMREWFEWVMSKHFPTPGEPFDTRNHVRDVIERAAMAALNGIRETFPVRAGAQWPLPNVWLGVSVEDQDAADERIPELLGTPASTRFLSLEPLLGPVDLTRIGSYNGTPLSALEEVVGYVNRPAIDLAIVGCESGPGARPCGVELIRALRDQCIAARVAFFLKQAKHTDAHGGPIIKLGAGSKAKPRGVIELPYLDGVQHANFPHTTVT